MGVGGGGIYYGGDYSKYNGTLNLEWAMTLLFRIVQSYSLCGDVGDVYFNNIFTQILVI